MGLQRIQRQRRFESASDDEVAVIAVSHEYANLCDARNLARGSRQGELEDLRAEPRQAPLIGRIGARCAEYEQRRKQDDGGEYGHTAAHGHTGDAADSRRGQADAQRREAEEDDETHSGACGPDSSFTAYSASVSICRSRLRAHPGRRTRLAPNENNAIPPNMAMTGSTFPVLPAVATTVPMITDMLPISAENPLRIRASSFNVVRRSCSPCSVGSTEMCRLPTDHSRSPPVVVVSPCVSNVVLN